MFDETAAAWGKFQVVYAWLDQSLALALFHLEERTDPSEFVSVQGSPFGRKLSTLEKFENGRDGRLPGTTDSICDRLRKLQNWRNPRVHARVEIGDSESYGFALFDARTRLRLPMNPPDIRGYTERAIILADTLRTVASFAATSNRFMSQEFDEVLGVPDPADQA